jgi:hypothetical protein
MGRSKHLDFDIVKKRARELRSNATPSETLLWNELRNRKLCGYKFLRQHPIVYNPYGSWVRESRSCALPSLRSREGMGVS